jgi:type I restriction-modification system DNA methylase subunit|nr:MAG TPA: N-6 DNA Methylase [Caudoviricetes sp.]
MHIKEFISEISNIKSVHPWIAYSDFMEVSVCTLKKPFEYIYDENIDNKFLSVLKKYNDKEKEIFPKLLGIFISLMDIEASKGFFTDIAGKIFHLLNAENKRTGQFFTPSNLGYLTASVMDRNIIKKTIDEQGYIVINEPACGSGSLILGLATLMLELGYNPQKQLFIRATDIDKRCVDMCFNQLSYYGLSAVIVHGNTLTQEEWDKLYTPFYLLFNSRQFK